MEQTESIRSLAVRACLAAGRLCLDRLSDSHEITMKGPVDLVTQTDHDSEALITDMILEEFPAHRVLAEEGTDRGQGDHLWIVDPLDGTINFSHGYPNFSVSIAYAHRGQVMVAAVYGPSRNELFTACRGKGSFLGTTRLSVSATREAKRALVATGFPYDREGRLPQTVAAIGEIASHVQNIRADGSAALDLCYVAAGRFDAFWENDLKAWDTAAGSLILTEAGGTISAGDGSDYSVRTREVLATNGHLHSEMLDIIRATAHLRAEVSIG